MPDTRLNIIYFVCHDLGRQLGCYGRPIESPNIDGFAARGVRFNKAFCNAPACSPSRGCAMTGQYSHTNGLMGLVNGGWSLPESRRTIVDCFNDAGYETAHVGLQHERWSSQANRYQVEGFGGGEDESFSSEFVENAVDRAVAFLESRRGADRPFYLNIGTREVHGSGWQGPACQLSYRTEVYGSVPLEEVHVPPYMPDFPPIRRELAKFQGCIRFFDRRLKTLFDAYEELGYADNTVFVFTTDHGISGQRAKGTIYDPGVEIALLVRLPGGRAAGMETDHLIQNIDLAPTLLEAAGADVPDTMQGRSFWPLLAGEDYAPHEAIFIERNYHGGFDPMRAVRTDGFHYIRNFDPKAKRAWLPWEVKEVRESYDRWYDELWPEPTEGRAAEELYDLQSDPNEFTNVAGEAKYADVRKDLAARVDSWMRETDDPLLKGPIPDRLFGWPGDEWEKQVQRRSGSRGN